MQSGNQKIKSLRLTRLGTKEVGYLIKYENKVYLFRRTVTNSSKGTGLIVRVLHHKTSINPDKYKGSLVQISTLNQNGRVKSVVTVL